MKAGSDFSRDFQRDDGELTIQEAKSWKLEMSKQTFDTPSLKSVDRSRLGIVRHKTDKAIQGHILVTLNPAGF